MNKQDKRENARDDREIRIDYDNIDIADIMAQIKNKIAAMPKRPPETESSLTDYSPSSVSPPEMPPEIEGTRSKLKGLLLKIMRPFSPVIKLLILPVHHELTETVRKLDLTNKKLDYWTEKLDRDLYRMSEILNTKIEEVDKTVNQRINFAFDEIGLIKEYTKLLHSLSHNLVVELTKLKIEQETYKLKSRILEKDFEFLGRREKALEEQVLK
ncbi:MAG: hypothetical protein JXB23_10060 [Candidatus Aminicenantes bacterium]|nr:hypothetical protein [Candidatus Aminicenantes bacterium]